MDPAHFPGQVRVVGIDSLSFWDLVFPIEALGLGGKSFFLEEPLPKPVEVFGFFQVSFGVLGLGPNEPTSRWQVFFGLLPNFFQGLFIL